MPARRARPPSELPRLLDEQLQFLEASAAAYDAGFDGEAKRLAVAIRVLAHDTKNSVSLLEQLGKKTVQFLDSSFPNTPGNQLPHGGLVFIAMAGAATRYIAMLDDIPPAVAKWVSFDKWWSTPIFVDRHTNTLSRSDLVLTAANQDGGAHVDPALDERYAALSRDHSLGWVALHADGETAIEGAEKAAIRQIAHEVLKTLKPGYEKKPNLDAAMIIGQVSYSQGPVATPPTPPREEFGVIKKVGRNAPCPCGSGLKFKKCHGSSKT